MATSKYKPPRTYGWYHEYDQLAQEFAWWGISDWSATPNVMLSRANSSNLTRQERAVTLTFVKDGRTVTLPMADYETATMNLKVLALCIRDMRMIERRGVSETLQSAYLQLAAPERERDPFEVLGLRPGASADEIEAMYRVKAKTAHPDAGGSDDAMAALNRAREVALGTVAR